MKDLIKTGLVLAICFAATFGILVATGLLQRDDVVRWLEAAREIDAWIVALIVMGHQFGRPVLRRIISDEIRLAEMEEVFARYGLVVLMICRAMPILPEVSCCLAGVTRMRFTKFGFGYLIGTVPYVIVCAWLGAQSSTTDPMPAIWGSAGVTVVMWSFWFFLIRHHRRSTQRTLKG